MANESKIQKEILDFLKQHGFWAINIVGGVTQKRGTPDILACVQGLFVALEVKDPTGNHPVTSAQQINLRKIRSAGGIGAVVTSVDEVRRIMESINDLPTRG